MIYCSIVVFVYVLISFACWSPNPADWEMTWRVIGIIALLLLSVGAHEKRKRGWE
jgi:hypothetical protein